MKFSIRLLLLFAIVAIILYFRKPLLEWLPLYREPFLLPNCSIGVSQVGLDAAVAAPYVYIKHAKTGTYLLEDASGATPVNQTITDYRSAPRYKIEKSAAGYRIYPVSSAGVVDNTKYYEVRNRFAPVTTATDLQIVANTGAPASFAIGSSAATDAAGGWLTAVKLDANNVNIFPTTNAGTNYLTNVTQVACGLAHTVAITTNGDLYVWGSNMVGQLGYTKAPFIITPTLMLNMPTNITKFIQISCGASHTVAIADNGNIYACGFNDNGQLGNGTYVNQDTFVPIINPGNVRFIQIACGDANTAAITDTGDLYTWGNNNEYQLGDGTRDSKNIPNIVIKPSNVTKFTQVRFGYAHTLALTDNGEIYAWGRGMYGQLGVAELSMKSYSTPVLTKKPSNINKFTQIACGWNHSAAIADDGNLYCWGSNNKGQLAISLYVDKLYTPTKTSKPQNDINFTRVYCGQDSTFVIGNNGNIYACGLNNSGQLGDGTRDNKSTLVIVVKPSNITYAHVNHYYEHTAAISDTGNLYTWGNNGNGQLGDGTTTQSSIPIQPVLPDPNAPGNKADSQWIFEAPDPPDKCCSASDCRAKQAALTASYIPWNSKDLSECDTCSASFSGSYNPCTTPTGDCINTQTSLTASNIKWSGSDIPQCQACGSLKQNSFDPCKSASCKAKQAQLTASYIPWNSADLSECNYCDSLSGSYQPCAPGADCEKTQQSLSASNIKWSGSDLPQCQACGALKQNSFDPCKSDVCKAKQASLSASFQPWNSTDLSECNYCDSLSGSYSPCSASGDCETKQQSLSASNIKWSGSDLPQCQACGALKQNSFDPCKSDVCKAKQASLSASFQPWNSTDLSECNYCDSLSGSYSPCSASGDCEAKQQSLSASKIAWTGADLPQCQTCGALKQNSFDPCNSNACKAKQAQLTASYIPWNSKDIPECDSCDSLAGSYEPCAPGADCETKQQSLSASGIPWSGSSLAECNSCDDTLKGKSWAPPVASSSSSAAPVASSSSSAAPRVASSSSSAAPRVASSSSSIKPAASSSSLAPAPVIGSSSSSARQIVAATPYAPVEQPKPQPPPASVGNIVIIDTPSDSTALRSRIKQKLDEQPQVQTQAEVQQPLLQLPQKQPPTVDCSKYDYKNNFPTNLIDRIVCDVNKVLDAAKTLLE